MKSRTNKYEALQTQGELHRNGVKYNILPIKLKCQTQHHMTCGRIDSLEPCSNGEVGRIQTEV